MSSIQFKTGFTMCATVAAGLCLVGCRTIHSDRSANRAISTPTVAEADEGVRPTPPVLDAEPVKATIHTPSPVTKETPWYISHGEVSEKAPAKHAGTGAAASGTYIVQKGDIAGRIAIKNGVTLAALKAANPGKDLNKIKVGQTIVIPAKAGASKSAKATSQKAEAGTHIVQKGEILGRIARQYGVKVADLKAANGLTSDKISVGQKLVIPGKATKQTAKTEDKAAGTTKDSASNAGKLQLPNPPPMPQPMPPTVTKPEVPSTPVPANVPSEIPSEMAKPEVIKTTQVEPIQTTGVDIAPVVIEPSMPVAPVAKVTDGETHTVVAGEDLLSLAIRWSISPEDIRKLNNLGKDDQIKPGDILKIPPHN